MCDFALKSLLHRFHWERPRAIRLSVRNNAQERYRERIITDPSGYVVRIERRYPAAARPALRAWLTDDPKVAEAWRGSGTAEGAGRRLLCEVSSHETLRESVSGVIYQPDESSLPKLAQLASRSGLDLSLVVPGVYEFERGVWVHESSRIEPGTQFVGSVLVGAGVAVTDRVLVGPFTLNDDLEGIDLAAKRSVDLDMTEPSIEWDLLKSSEYRLAPSFTRRWVRRSTKRAFDVCVAGGVLLCVLPIFPVVMLLIWREDGRPFFFSHTRQTLGGRDFPCHKFRTMVNNADSMKAELAAKNQADGPQFFIKDDPRLLRCGRWMRRFQIDELPQLWNIVRGQMSIVGPRPSPDKENQFCPGWREARLSIRPGLTGLWQVRRTREPMTDFQEWIRYDLEYVQRESWRLDVWIMFETARQIVFGGRGSK